MSLPVSPILNLDVASRRADRWLATAILLSTPLAVALLQQTMLVLVIATALAIACLTAGFHSVGWLGGARRIVGIARRPDGQWMLRDASGRVSERTLSGATRVTPLAVWLRWRGVAQPLLLVPGDIPAADYRRLVVRLRLSDRLIPDGSNQ